MMADVYFKCVCGKSLSVDENGVGLTVSCVDCGQPVKVPEFDIEFDCEECQATLLAPVTVGGDRVKCVQCGHRMTAPVIDEGWRGVVSDDRALADDSVEGTCAVKDPPLEPAAKRCMDTLMNRRSEFVVRRRPAPEPTLSGWLFRLAILVGALVVTGELMHRFIQERRLISDPKEQSAEALAARTTDMTTVLQAATVPPASEATETPVPSVQKPEMIPEIAPVREMTAKDSVVLIKEPALSNNLIQAAVSSPTPALDRQTVRTLPAKTPEDTSSARSVLYPAKSLLDVVGESQKLNALINYKSGSKQSQEFFSQLRKSMTQINEYTQTHTGKDLDDFYWSTSYWLVYGYAIKTAPNYAEAEDILRRGWALLEGVESDKPRAIPRTVLSMGVNMVQDWVKQNPLGCAIMLDDLEGMAQEMGDDKIGDIWRLNAPYLQVRFMKYAGNVPEEKREAFVQRHKKRLETYLLDDSIRMRNRASTLRGWIVFLDKYGSLTDALPVIHEWPKRYGDKTLEMNYYFARLWVELFGEGDLEKAAKTVRLATQAAQSQRDGKLFDEKNYVKLIQLYYDSLRWPAYELKRQRTIARNKADKEELKTAFYKGKVK